ncbi:oligoendopeptidase F [Caldalkalibacillus thermarum TA2.A1]|uniref:Oligopeptidase F n=1 Tax=Caldalkalibacillus thermarum (strain TA2.A1) TaxID=986075 RepID=F5L511_CALTT|nr:oligoendopeptidase F [Caldalkalibacillus thermarum]EGL83587.1 oligoendopeptidase F [Caldalkalibacillus thermarum TA2.A1]
MTEQQKTTGQLPKRSELDPKYKWDLTKIFKSDEEWEEAFQEVKSLLPSIKEYEGRLMESADTLLEALQLRDEIGKKLGKVYIYAHLKKDEDTTNSKYVAFENRAASLHVEVASAVSYFSPEILRADESTVRSYLRENEALQVYEHYLDQLLRQKEHTLSTKEEAILAQVGELASAPNDIFTMINNADMKFPTITDENGEEKELTHGRYIQFLESKDRRVRQDAFKAMYDTFKKQRNTLAATLNANVKKDVFYARVRKYRSSLEASLDRDNVPVRVYENLIAAIQEALPVFQRYMKLRKKALGLDELHMYDLYVPLVQDVEMKYTYEEAKQLVRDSLQPLGEEYLAVVDEGFNSGWIDVYENVGKRSGAYSSGTYGTPPYILLNYQENLDNVFTLTHEMGHSVHSYFSCKEQPYIYSDYTIFVAEVASTLNEALLTHYLLQKTNDPKQRMYILNHYLESFRGTVFRQTMFAEFEKLIHEKVEEGEALTADRLSELYYDLNLTYFGADVVVDQDIAMEWARIPHFYYNFYVYKYATGFAAATALSQQILNEGKPAVDRYLSFLKSGGSDYPIELLKKAGVDMTSPEPVRQALRVFERTLTEMEELFGKHQ